MGVWINPLQVINHYFPSLIVNRTKITTGIKHIPKQGTIAPVEFKKSISPGLAIRLNMAIRLRILNIPKIIVPILALVVVFTVLLHSNWISQLGQENIPETPSSNSIFSLHRAH
tara:strand:- start:271 stop:612 length:342 start_codon:yes stop_codon:yes gene_type:complete